MSTSSRFTFNHSNDYHDVGVPNFSKKREKLAVCKQRET